MKSFYSSFLLRLRWDRDRGVLGGEIQRVQTSGEEPAEPRSFRGLDVDRIVDFVNENLDSPDPRPEQNKERNTGYDGTLPEV